ncbi:MAG TPA: YafY family protein [Gaiellaceae bacterium]|nr:YafY family protein [Gaiellaceae bacterium]
MSSSTPRLLALLEVLQARPVVTGRELADRLGVDGRTVRRYVAELQELGIPVEGQRGAGGGYRMRPGYRLPPLMLTDDEAVVVVLGLVGSRRLGHDTAGGAAEGALEKIHRVLPAPLRRRVEALEATLGFTLDAAAGAPVPGETALLLADAIRRRRRIRGRYRAHGGEASERELSPHGLVVHGGRWYLAAWDHGRDDLRTFRVDRLDRCSPADEPAVPPPAGFDAVDHVSRSLASVPWAWEVEVELDAEPARVRERIPATLAELEDLDGRILLRMRVESLDWMARILAGLDCDFAVRRPEELRASLRALASRLGRAAG